MTFVLTVLVPGIKRTFFTNLAMEWLLFDGKMQLKTIGNVEHWQC